jgi:predicted dehydrogenase
VRLAAVGLLLAAACSWTAAAQSAPPVRLAVVGLVHDHARLLFPMLEGRPDIRLVGVVESNPQLIKYYVEHFNLDPALFSQSLRELAARTKVDAAALFTTTQDHRAAVEECAALGIDVMMEKPLAVDAKDARAIAAAAHKGKIQAFVNYETTWYPSNALAHQLVDGDHLIGDIRKVLVQDGHQGPEQIGTSPFFLNWLSDPGKGGGAMLDFGCYGADLITWMMGGARPASVLAVTQNLQPITYPRVEDECTIVLTYPTCQGIIQASWNWPYGRKDMEVYGQFGAVFVPDRDTVRVRLKGAEESAKKPPALEGPDSDQLSLLVAVVRGERVPQGMSSIAYNLTVTDILDAARESARTGRQVTLGQDSWH